MKDTSLAVFEGKQIRRYYDENTETWYFSVVDIIQVLIQQPDYQTARKYWNKLKERLKKEGSESVTNCHRLKMGAADGKKYFTDTADPETLLRLIQSVPSPKAEPIKLWLAKVGYERMQDMADPARSLDWAREYWQQHGESEKWIHTKLPSSTHLRCLLVALLDVLIVRLRRLLVAASVRLRMRLGISSE
jgi:DNA-damage-inducible protein D